jgi:hypothetical protein
VSNLRAAAQQALEALEDWDSPVALPAITAIRAALEQEQPEPVLVVEKEPDYMSRGHFYEGSKPFIDPTLVWKLPIGTKLYTHPPRREWQGLSEQEVAECDQRSHANTDWGKKRAFAHAVEAALKERNHE